MGAEIMQVLFLADPQKSRDLGPALWAALIEVERFYNFGQTRASFQRKYISPYVPSLGPLDQALRGVSRLVGAGPNEVDDARALLSQEARMQTPASNVDFSGRYRKTYDQRKLFTAMQELMPEATSEASLNILTDYEITPPEDYRYIIWDNVSNGSVISLAPTDPIYWREQDSERVATIKHRVRAAALSVTGTSLKLEYCDNPRCFLYEDVDSVTALDLMSHLGKEHGIPELAGRGFDRKTTDPGTIQNVVEVPRTELWEEMA